MRYPFRASILNEQAKTTRSGSAREGITSRPALPGFADFVAAASRRGHGLNQREAGQAPFDRLERRHRVGLAGVAQQRHVRYETLGVEADVRARKRASQF